MTVDFIRHTWQDWPSTETPITADELNRLEEGIAGLYSDLDGIDLANIEQTVDDLEEAVENFKAGVEITQEEYDNLTPEEKNNGTVYYITDAPSTPAISALDASYNNSTSGLQATNVQGAVDELNSKHVYSETEKRIGTWINGNPLYKITVAGTKVAGTTLSISMPENIDKIVSMEGCLNSVSGASYNLSRYESTGSTYATADPLQKTFAFFSSAAAGVENYFNGYVVATIKYTKTTD